MLTRVSSGSGSNDLCDFPDLTCADAIRLQASFPGAHVHEHRSSYDDIIEFFSQSLLTDVNCDINYKKSV